MAGVRELSLLRWYVRNIWRFLASALRPNASEAIDYIILQASDLSTIAVVMYFHRDVSERDRREVQKFCEQTRHICHSD